MSATGIIGLAVVSALLCFILRESGFRGVKLFSTVAAVMLFASAAGTLGKLAEKIGGLGALSGAGEGVGCMLRLVGVGYSFGFASDICNEMGESGIGRALTVCGRCELVIVGMPYLVRLFELVAAIGGEV
jgi:hypothetical protein